MKGPSARCHCEHSSMAGADARDLSCSGLQGRRGPEAHESTTVDRRRARSHRQGLAAASSRRWPGRPTQAHHRSSVMLMFVSGSCADVAVTFAAPPDAFGGAGFPQRGGFGGRGRGGGGFVQRGGGRGTFLYVLLMRSLTVADAPPIRSPTRFPPFTSNRVLSRSTCSDLLPSRLRSPGGFGDRGGFRGGFGDRGGFGGDRGGGGTFAGALARDSLTHERLD